MAKTKLPFWRKLFEALCKTAQAVWGNKKPVTFLFAELSTWNAWILQFYGFNSGRTNRTCQIMLRSQWLDFSLHYKVASIIQSPKQNPCYHSAFCFRRKDSRWGDYLSSRGGLRFCGIVAVHDDTLDRDTQDLQKTKHRKHLFSVKQPIRIVLTSESNKVLIEANRALLNLPVRLNKSEIMLDLIFKSRGESLRKSKKNNVTYIGHIFKGVAGENCSQIGSNFSRKEFTHQAREGDRLTSMIQGLKFSSIKMSNPYSSEEEFGLGQRFKSPTYFASSDPFAASLRQIKPKACR